MTKTSSHQNLRAKLYETKQRLGDRTKNRDEAWTAESLCEVRRVIETGEGLACLHVCQVDRGPAWLFDMQHTGVWLQARQRSRHSHRSCPSVQSWGIESVPSTLTSLWVTSIPQSSNASNGPLRRWEEGQIAVFLFFRHMPQTRLPVLSEIRGTRFSRVLS